MTSQTYEWREWTSLFRRSQVTIDFENETVEFRDAIRSKSFFNLLPIRVVSFKFSELTEIRAYTESGYRCVLVESATAKGIFMNSEVPNFDGFEETMLSIRQPDE
jgi:hypothetical protein